MVVRGTEGRGVTFRKSHEHTQWELDVTLYKVPPTAGIWGVLLGCQNALGTCPTQVQREQSPVLEDATPWRPCLFRSTGHKESGGRLKHR